MYCLDYIIITELIKKGAIYRMGTAIIFLLVALLAVFGTISALKNKNFLGIIFGAGALGVFGFFAIMTLIKLPESLPQ